MFEILLPLAPGLIYWLIRQRDAHKTRRIFRRIMAICAYAEVQTRTHRVAVVVVMDEADRDQLIALVAELIAYGRKRGVPWFIRYLDIHAMDDPVYLPEPINACLLRPDGESPQNRRFRLFKRERRRDLELLQNELGCIIRKHYPEHDKRARETGTVRAVERTVFMRKESRGDLVRQQKVELGDRKGRVKPRKAA